MRIGGAGRVGWDSDIRDERRARQTGIESIGRQIRNLIVDNQHIFTNKAALDVFEIDVTTLTRIFSSTLGQNTFRLKVENKTLTPQLPLDQIAPALEFMLDMFVSHGYNVNDVRKYENQVVTLGHIPPEILPDSLAEAAKVKVRPAQPDTTNGGGTVGGHSAGGNGDSGDEKGTNAQPGGGNGTRPGVASGPQSGGTKPGKPDGTENIKPEPPASPGIRAKPQARARKYLTPWSLKISNSRINAIYNELRAVLRVDECPNAVAITFRVFIETTCDEYARMQKDAGKTVLRWDTNNELRGGGNGDKLVMKVQSVVKHLEAEKKIAAPAAKAIFKRASSYDQPGSVDHFNLFVHGTHSAPLPSELKDIAEEYQPMLEAIWR